MGSRVLGGRPWVRVQLCVLTPIAMGATEKKLACRVWGLLPTQEHTPSGVGPGRHCPSPGSMPAGCAALSQVLNCRVPQALKWGYGRWCLVVMLLQGARMCLDCVSASGVTRWLDTG